MKKIIAVLLSLMLVLTACSALAQAAPEKIRFNYDQSLGFDVVCPVFYTMSTQRFDQFMIIEMNTEEEGYCPMTLLICPDEEYADLVRLNDLSEEDLTAYAISLTEGYNNPTWDILETEYGTKVILINENDADVDYAELITVYHGYALDLFMFTEEGELEDWQIDTALLFMSQMDFVYAE